KWWLVLRNTPAGAGRGNIPAGAGPSLGRMSHALQDDPVVSAQTVVRGSAPGSQCPRPTATQRATTGYPTPPPERRSKQAPVTWTARADASTLGHIRDLSTLYYPCRQECFVPHPPTGSLPWHRQARLHPERRAPTPSRRRPSRLATTP